MIRNLDNCKQISEDVLSIRNAVIEDIVADKRHMIATVSYQILENRRAVTRMLCLIINGNTTVNAHDQTAVSIRQLKTGMKINALVCTDMTKCTPAQTKAYFITILEEEKKKPMICTGKIISVDGQSQSFLVGVPWNRNRKIRFFVTRNTVILGANKKRMGFCQLTSGMNIRVEHSELQVLSGPPQAKAYQVQIL